MKRKNFTRLIFLLVIGLVYSNLQAQLPGTGIYGNEWLAGKYGQDWLRIGVTKKGIQSVTLPTGFKNKSTGLHLYHRGVEVALISATNTTIEFYGVPNDGASDAILYRPYTGVRANPYYSWFSDESAYFLTYSANAGTKLAIDQAVLPLSGDVEPYHMEKELTVFSSSDTYDGSQNLVTHSLDQSYFVDGKGRSSKAYYKRLPGTKAASGDPVFPFPFQLKNLIINPSVQPEIEILLNGRTNSNNQIKVSIGKTSSSLTANPALVEFSGFITHNVKYPIPVSTDASASNVDANGNGHFQLESMKTTTENETTGIFSVNYIVTKYPQTFDMSGLTSKTFNLVGTTNANSNISISNAPAGARIFDITDLDNPRLIAGSYNGTTLQAMVARLPNKELNLLVTTVSSDNNKLSTVLFTSYSPGSKDYLIISSGNLISAADSYAAYRSTDGGAHKTLVVNIKDIYNQFNYGEPSPVAIRRFVDYMLKDGRRKEHSLLLIGVSTTLWSKMVREIPDEVPTIGFPGSDNLLIEGLAGSSAEVQAIPIGRIPATTTDQVTNYLNKVKAYELPQTNLEWRRKVLHISGGLKEDENIKFAKYLSDYSSLVTAVPFKGSVSPKVKADYDFGYPNTSLDISGDINSGVGFTAYFGHGTSRYTDNDIGYATDATRKYSNSGKYPVMYFNGCGVGNIFNGAFSPFPADPASSQIPLSADWLLAEGKGAIAVIANSYYAFETSSDLYLGALYQGLFKGDAGRKNLGLIHRDASMITMTGSPGTRVAASSFDVANSHQSLLLGDPAIQVLTLQNPLPVELIYFRAKVQNESKVQLEWKTAWEKNNSHFVIQRSYNSKTFENIGLVEGKGDVNSETLYAFTDNDPNSGANYYRLMQVDKALGNTTTKTGGEYSRIIAVKLPDSDKLILMPNPTSDLVKINLENNLEVKSARIINVNGRATDLGKIGKEISLKNYPTGQYFLEVTTVAGDVYRKKIFKN